MTDNNKFISELYKRDVKDLMKTVNDDVMFVEKNADINSVFSALQKKDHVWVVENKDSMRVIGIITQYDTLGLFSPPYTPLQSFEKSSLQSFQYGLPSKAEDVMSKKPISTNLNEKIIDVILKMKQYKVKQLPVVDNKEVLLGEITLNQLIDKYQKESTTMKRK